MCVDGGLELTATDHHFNGKDVAKAIIRVIDRDTPILVHSSNVTEAPRVVNLLKGADFVVTRIPMSNLTQERFLDWIGTVREDSD